jgi:hypothetical protein
LKKECLVNHKTSFYLSAEEFEIGEIHRLDGDLNPEYDGIVYEICSKIHNMKGVVVNEHGLYSDSKIYKYVSRLKNHF